MPFPIDLGRIEVTKGQKNPLEVALEAYQAQNMINTLSGGNNFTNAGENFEPIPQQNPFVNTMPLTPIRQNIPSNIPQAPGLPQAQNTTSGVPEKESWLKSLLPELPTLLAAGVGLAAPGALPGAAGFAQGYEGERKRQRESGEKKELLTLQKMSKASQAQQQMDLRAKEASDAAIESANDVLDTIAKVEEGINYFGLLGAIPSIPGTERYVWETNLNKLLSQKILDTMTLMKRASKTGATGFGQLSNKELAVLQQASTSLKKSTPPEEAQKILGQMRASLEKVLTTSSVNNSSSQNVEYDPSALSDEELDRKILELQGRQ